MWKNLAFIAPVAFAATAGDALVCLAHESILWVDAAKVWRRHLDDYKVKPVIEQFDRGHFQLSEVKRAALSLNDFQGHVLEAVKLRGRLTKLGYTRGATGDGGWFLNS
jgi:Domain of unknown function (DUF4132)